MNTIKVRLLSSSLLVLSLVLSACGVMATDVPATSTLRPSATITHTPTNTPFPTNTPRPTRTPDLAATQHAEELNAEIRKYFELGYLSSDQGGVEEYRDFGMEWAQLNWYDFQLLDLNVHDFLISAHFKWSSAYRNANIAGCGIAFAIQPNIDHYAVFLDRSQILFLNADYSVSNRSYAVGLTRGTGRVKFDNPADQPVEADFTLIVKDEYAYVLVNGEVVGEYTLSKSKVLKGDIALSLLSGTNKDFGTRCEMTNIHVFIPNE